MSCALHGHGCSLFLLESMNQYNSSVLSRRIFDSYVWFIFSWWLLWLGKSTVMYIAIESDGI